MSQYLLSIDQSLRSTGICLFENQSLVDFKIISTEKFDGELFEHTLGNISDKIIKSVNDLSNINFVIEKQSLQSKSSLRDVLFSLHWIIRTDILRKFPNSNIGCVPVSAWRNWFTTKEDRKKAKDLHKKNHNKMVTVDKIKELYPRQYDLFNNYIKEHKFKKDSIYDLSDAFALGLYRLQLV